MTAEAYVQWRWWPERAGLVGDAECFCGGERPEGPTLTGEETP